MKNKNANIKDINSYFNTNKLEQTQEEEHVKEINNYLLIDTSYYIFYRYFALESWWKLAKKEKIEDPINNEEFVLKFEKLFISKLKEFIKKLKIDSPVIIFAKDCSRTSNWRNQYTNAYKATRDYSNFNGFPFFNHTYTKLLDDYHVIYNKNIEADDCIAITSKYLLHMFENINIYIITNDMDYLQLANKNTFIYNLKFKKINENKKSYNNAEKDLLAKIIMGDKSDNIKGVFDKCSKKNLELYLNNQELLFDDLNKFNVLNKFKCNRQIIDFDYIPEVYYYDIQDQINKIISIK